MTNSQSPHWKRKLIFWIFLFSFIPATILVVGYASGLRIDRATGQVVETSSLAITTQPTDAVVLLDGVAQKTSTPYLETIRPGTYRLDIEKDYYRRWSKLITLEAGRAAVFHHILLFPDTIPLPIASLDDRTSNPGIVDEAVQRHYRDLGWIGTDQLQLHSGAVLVNPLTKQLFIVDTPTGAHLNRMIRGHYVTSTWNKHLLLIATDHELWQYNKKTDQLNLIIRQQLPILDVTWHTDGYYCFMSDLTGIRAIELPQPSSHNIQTWQIVSRPSPTGLRLSTDGRQLWFNTKMSSWSIDLE